MDDSMEGSTREKKSIFKKMLHSLTFSGGRAKSSPTANDNFQRSKSCHRPITTATVTSSSDHHHQKRGAKLQVTPQGCFCVYVGEEKQKFVIKTKCASHPLFRMLLDDAESEYGFRSEGPILIPCDVDLFYKVLAEMESGRDLVDPGCCLGYGGCSPFNPTRRLGRHSDMAKGCGSYGVLNPSPLLKMNQF